MIISHKHKFIFFKTRKTAGSSIQVALAKHCGSDDIVTGQYRDGIDDNSQSAGLNMDRFYTNHPHPEIVPTKMFIEQNFGKEVWDSYFKFGFIRNPYEIVVSRYFWERRGKGGTIEDCSIEDFKEFTKKELLEYEHDWLHPYIAINDKIELDFIGKYETLQDDFKFICQKLNLPNTELPFKKGGFREKKHYSTYYDDETKDVVKNFFKKDIELFGYNFNSEFYVNKFGPIITQDMLKNNLGDNINGPSVIKVPEWIENPLGKYYLYFAHHDGKFIRMAYSDDMRGPWKIYHDGTLKLEDSACEDHIASPDVHVDNKNKRIIMYYHGVTKSSDAPHNQCSFTSFSKNGLDFISKSRILGMFYFRVFEYNNKFYAIAKNKNIDGILYESEDGLSDFKPVFNLIPNMRHCATWVNNDYLYVFYTAVGDTPESIMMYKIKLDKDIEKWEIVDTEYILKPEFDWEGGNLPLQPSKFGASLWPVNEVRDPCIFEDDDNLYLLYTIAGEFGVALSKLYKVRN